MKKIIFIFILICLSLSQGTDKLIELGRYLKKHNRDQDKILKNANKIRFNKLKATQEQDWKTYALSFNQFPNDPFVVQKYDDDFKISQEELKNHIEDQIDRAAMFVNEELLIPGLLNLDSYLKNKIESRLEGQKVQDSIFEQELIKLSQSDDAQQLLKSIENLASQMFNDVKSHEIQQQADLNDDFAQFNDDYAQHNDDFAQINDDNYQQDDYHFNDNIYKNDQIDQKSVLVDDDNEQNYQDDDGNEQNYQDDDGNEQNYQDDDDNEQNYQNDEDIDNIQLDSQPIYMDYRIKRAIQPSENDNNSSPIHLIMGIINNIDNDGDDKQQIIYHAQDADGNQLSDQEKVRQFSKHDEFFKDLKDDVKDDARIVEQNPFQNIFKIANEQKDQQELNSKSTDEELNSIIYQIFNQTPSRIMRNNSKSKRFFKLTKSKKNPNLLKLYFN